MFKKNNTLRSIFSLLLVLVMVLSTGITTIAEKDDLIHITILGTTDMHANLFNWSYEDAKDLDDRGMTKVYTAIEHFRKENPNTILIDNGDTIQGTMLSDDLYNTDLSLKNPIIDAMNFMDYDAMVLGNHEFNFGLELIEKIQKEADFPILAANANYKKDGKLLAEPYTIVEVAGVKVGIMGFTNKNIPRWDGSKVEDLEFTNPAKAAGKYIDELRKKSDVIIASSHANFEEQYGDDASKEIVEKYPEIAALMVGHSHGTVNEKVGNTPVGGARDAGREMVKFDLYLKKDGKDYSVEKSDVEIIEIKDFEASEELKKHSKDAHEKTLEFIDEKLGTATADFQAKNEINGIPQAQLEDTALIDLINNVQLKAAGADVSSAALFQSNAKLNKGDINFANIFNIYKHPNTVLGVEINGKQLKEYMEWSAEFYNTWKKGDINISFNENVRGYRYDMFQGVDYKIDLSKPAGERIVDIKFKGKELKDTDKIKLAVNNYRYDNLVSEGIIEKTQEPYFDSDPKALRTYIAEYIRERGKLDPIVDNNWEIVGIDLEHPAREYIINEVNAGNIELPKSEDGRSYNIKALNADQMLADGIIPEDYDKVKTEVTILVDGKEMKIAEEFGKAFIEDGRTLIPVRAFAENLDHKVEWDSKNWVVTIDSNIKLTIDENEIIIDGEKLEMDTSAKLVKGRTYVPLSFISEALGYEVNWNANSKTVEVITKVAVPAA